MTISGKTTRSLHGIQGDNVKRYIDMRAREMVHGQGARATCGERYPAKV